jgi:acylphosphatase
MSAAQQTLQRMHAVVRGFVQRVGFRQFALRRARSLDLSGWVTNRADGAVEITAEGGRAKLEAFLEYVRKGPTYARVKEVEVEWGEAKHDLDRFEIRFTP